MFSFQIYCILTLITTFYFFYNLYQRENQIFIFTIYLVKSKFHFCLLINFVLMIVIAFGKMMIKLFFGEVRLSEMIQVVEKIKMRFVSFLLLFLTFRPTIDVSKIFVVVVYHCMAILNMLAFKRSDYIVSSEDKSLRSHSKILSLYLTLGLLDYYCYSFLNSPINSQEILSSSSSKNSSSNFDSLIYYIFSSEFIFLLIKLIAKFIKLSIDLTQIHMRKHWNHKSFVFNMISFISYTIKLVIEIRFCIILIRVGVVPLFFIIDVSHSCWNLIKFGYKICDNYKINKHISSLPDYIPVQDEDKKEEITCYICFEELKVGKRLNCGHTFHLRCIKEWVQSSVGCPLCKVPVTNERKTLRRHNDEFPEDNFNVDQGRGENLINNNENILNADQNRDKINNTFTSQSPQQVQGKIHPDMKKLKIYQEIARIAVLADINQAQITNSSSSGAISFSLPTAAIHNRTVNNEIKRLEIENYNRKMLEIYENPFNAVSRSWEKN